MRCEMKTLQFQRRIESETLHLPELKAYVGKTVEITIVVPPREDGRWDALRNAAGQDLVDPDVVQDYRAADSAPAQALP